MSAESIQKSTLLSFMAGALLIIAAAPSGAAGPGGAVALADPPTAPAAASPAGQKPVFEPLDVFALSWVADPEISPDGRRIAFVRMRMDIRSDRPRGAIWLIDADGAHAEPLSSASDTSAPRWSPDGERIAYVGRAENDAPQLFVYWTRSHVTTAITHLTETPASLAWSPDGRWIAFTSPVPMERKPLKVELPEAPKEAHWAAPPNLIDRMVFRVDGEGYLPNMYRQVFIVAADGGPARQVTHGDFDHADTPSWSADARSLFISANRHEDADFRPLDTEVYRIDLADDSIHALTDRRGPDDNPVVSPDGRLIAYLGFDDQVQGHQNVELYVMDADGRHPRSISGALDRDVVRARWRADGKALFVLYEDHGTLKLASIALTGAQQLLASDIGGGDVTRPYTEGSFSVAKDGRFAYTLGSPYAPPALATGTRAGEARTLLAASENLLAARTLAHLEPIHFESSFDHAPVEGWILTPPGFDPHKRYPLVLEIHGGPFASYGPTFAAELELYAAAGYVVLYVNPRGSTGYGQQFANAIHHDYPGHDFDDLMSGVDALIARGYVDPQRLFVTGGSGGGVLSAWIVGHTDRFRAAVVVKPVINWTSFVLTADLTSFFYKYGFAALPWEDLDTYWKHSPLAYAAHVTTPTMLMTGEVDYRTPSSEAEQFYEALKLRKVDTALVRVPGASHDISARPSLLIAKVNYILAWFAAHDVKHETSPATTAAARSMPAF